MSSTHGFADRLGRFFEQNGLPRMAGRVLGHLLTCDPPEQTFDEVVAAMAASRSSVSVATQLLVRLDLVDRFGVPGERSTRSSRTRSCVATLTELRLAAMAATTSSNVCSGGSQVSR